MSHTELNGILGPIRRVAIVRATRLGDFMCAVPTLRSLRLALPDAEITLIALPFAREMVKRFPLLDRHEEFPGYPGIRETSFTAQRALAFLAQQQRRRYDLAIQLHGSGVFSNPFTLMLGARYTVGFTRSEDQGFGLDRWVDYPNEGHEVHRVLEMARLLGTPDAGTHLEFPLLEEDHEEVRRLAGHHGIDLDRAIIGVHPGAKNLTRRWPPERFAEAASRLAERIGAEVTITGSPNEWYECLAVAEALTARSHNLVGQTSVGGLAALMSHMTLLLTNDTGPAHIAYALGTPSVTIFGAAEPEVWGPLDTTRHKAIAVPLACRPCGLELCEIGYRCLTQVTVERVVEVAESLLTQIDGDQTQSR